jgi:hypothetical protein
MSLHVLVFGTHDLYGDFVDLNYGTLPPLTPSQDPHIMRASYINRVASPGPRQSSDSCRWALDSTVVDHMGAIYCEEFQDLRNEWERMIQ